MILNLDCSSTRQSPHYIPDDYHESSSSLHPTLYQGHLESVLIPHSLIVQRTNALAQEIHQTYGPNEIIVLLCVLKGASVFFHYLLNALSDLQQPFQYEFIRCSSYSGTSSTHTVLVENMDKLQVILPQRNVIVVEDIVDTGLTLKILLPQLQNTCHPKSLYVCTLLEKRVPRPDLAVEDEGFGVKQAEEEDCANVVAQFCGFSIPNKFIIGFGLDFNDLYRDLKDIWVISELGVSLGGKILTK